MVRYGGIVINQHKRNMKPEKSFLNSAARVLGSALGRLAAKTGLGCDVEQKSVAPAAKSKRIKTISPLRNTIGNPTGRPQQTVTRTKKTSIKRSPRKVTKTAHKVT
jgi:hypothetical protein